jgi:hypothetical protein
MGEWLKAIPWSVTAGASIVIFSFLAYLVVKAYHEGREVSFWPPRIGPRPMRLEELKVPEAKDPEGDQGKQQPPNEKRTSGIRNTTIPAVPIDSEPIALMHLISGSGQGTCLLISASSRSITIGRLEVCDVSLNHPTVASHHCHINIRPVSTEGKGSRRYEFVLIDSGSMNGTFVDGIQVHETNLRGGALIQVGACTLRFYELV